MVTYLADVKSGFAEHEQNQLGVALFVDKDTPMKYVKQVRNTLSEAAINVVFFALRNQDVRYSHDNEFYFVQRRVPSFCNSLYREGKKNKFFSSEGEIDSLTDEELDYKSSLFTVIKDNKIFVNGVEMNLSRLHDELERFMDLNHQSRRVIFCADDTSRYDFYLMVYNLLLMARHDFGDQYFAGRHRFSFRKALNEEKPYDCGSEYMKALNEFHTVAGPFLREITDEERDYMLSEYPALRPRLPH